MLRPSWLLVLAASYLIGAIPFAVLVGRWLHKIDVQQAGSGNAGARNTLETAGVSAGIVVMLLDAGKAGLALLLGEQVGGRELAALCGASAVVGHCFSLYLIGRWWGRLGGWKLALRRSGGKGLASGVLVLLLIAWPVALMVVAIFLIALLLQRKDVTWPTVLALLPAAPLGWWWTGSLPITLAILAAAAVISIKHLPDLREDFYVDQP